VWCLVEGRRGGYMLVELDLTDVLCRPQSDLLRSGYAASWTRSSPRLTGMRTMRHERIAACLPVRASPCPGIGLSLLPAHALYAAERR
jgi:hypothetical protein